MTTTIVLIRHAPHDQLKRVLCGRAPGVELGAAGRAAAEQVASRLTDETCAAVYTSPLARARQTAEPLAARQIAPLVVDEDLNEIDFGAWAGKSFDELSTDPLWRRWNEMRHQTRPPGGESLLEVQLRVVRFIHRVQEAHPGARVAAVSHADVIKSALCWAMGLTLESHARLEVSPASLNRIVVGEWGARVWNCNEAVD